MSAKAKTELQLRKKASAVFRSMRIGEIVTVIGISGATGPRIEGRAVIKGLALGPHRYPVQFVGDPVLRQRIVHPDYQRDPQRFLEILRDLWRASSSPLHGEFFPDEPKK